MAITKTAKQLGISAGLAAAAAAGIVYGTGEVETGSPPINCEAFPTEWCENVGCAAPERWEQHLEACCEACEED